MKITPSLFLFTSLVSLTLTGGFSAKASAQTASVTRGGDLFSAECSRCHVPSQWVGVLNNRWINKSGEELFTQIRATMPAETPGSLSDDEYYDVTAFILASANMPIEGGMISHAAINALSIKPGEAAPAAGAASSTTWTHLNGDERANRYAPLDQIDASNAADLEIAWSVDTGIFGPRPETYSVTSPLMVDGKLFATAGATRNVIALDAATGQLLWMWRPDEGKRFDDAPRKGSGKGLSYFNNAGEGVIFTMTPGYSLVALHAATGKPVESFGKNGVVDLQEGLRLGPGRDDLDIGISFPPLVVDGVVIAGAAHLVGMRPVAASNVKGDIRGFDARSGKLLWTFKSIPEKGEPGYETWLNGSAEYTGNAGVWTSMSADTTRGVVYLPVESATGDRYGADRLGSNLYASSTVAVDYRTGEKKWHFQSTHHDIWDWDTPAAPLVVDLPNGEEAVVQTLKQSHLFMFDPNTGRPIFAVEERPVPASDTPDEVTFPTQPFPVLPAPYDRQGFQEEDLNDMTPTILAKAKEIASKYRFSELYTPPSLYQHPADGSLGTLHLPSSTGGSNWEGAAYDPETGLLYVASRTATSVLSLVNEPEASSIKYIQGGARTPTIDGLPLVKPPYGRITAIDLVSGEHAWQRVNGDTPEEIKNHPLLKDVDLPPTGKPTRSGMVLTKSLLFFGEGPGGSPLLHAVDKATGETVAEIELPASVTGLPITYMHEGRQFIVMTVSDFRNPARLVALALPE
ncbi:MAG: PQQ-binding-like beta-propeller repeat protein [Pseudomonadales bacterium]|nr:PQQ-binding-like beta-propeller repeat protein [Pseudomonadales bacterium]MDA0805677.1 PQQ-binding-like beta-propeller repeat protein [Pseudomonadota bacterium]